MLHGQMEKHLHYVRKTQIDTYPPLLDYVEKTSKGGFFIKIKKSKTYINKGFRQDLWCPREESNLRPTA